MDGGLPALACLLFILGLTIRRLQKTDLWSGAIALSVFAFSSYPLSLFPFCLALTVFLSLASPNNRSGGVFINGAGLILFFGLCLVTNDSRERHKSAAEVSKALSFSKNGIHFDGLSEQLEPLYEEMKYDYHYLYELGLSLNKDGAFQQSISILQRGSHLSCDPVFHTIIGKNYQQLGQLELAREEFEYAQEMVPGRLYPRIRLMNLFLLTGEQEKALAIAKETASIPVNTKNRNMVELHQLACQCRDSLLNHPNQE